MDEKTARETIKNLRFHADIAEKEGRPERAKELRDEADIYEKDLPSIPSNPSIPSSEQPPTP